MVIENLQAFAQFLKESSQETTWFTGSSGAGKSLGSLVCKATRISHVDIDDFGSRNVSATLASTRQSKLKFLHYALPDGNARRIVILSEAAKDVAFVFKLYFKNNVWAVASCKLWSLKFQTLEQTASYWKTTKLTSDPIPQGIFDAIWNSELADRVLVGAPVTVPSWCIDLGSLPKASIYFGTCSNKLELLKHVKPARVVVSRLSFDLQRKIWAAKAQKVGLEPAWVKDFVAKSKMSDVEIDRHFQHAIDLLRSLSGYYHFDVVPVVLMDFNIKVEKLSAWSGDAEFKWIKANLQKK